MKIGNLQHIILNNINVKPKATNITFGQKEDVFEKSNSIQVIQLKKKDGKPRFIEYNGKDKAFIYKKVLNEKTQQIEKQKIEVCVGKLQYGHQTSYHLFDENSKEEIGFVKINDWRKGKLCNYYGLLSDSKLERDYIEQGIMGDRISIDFVENCNQSKYSGIGEATDQIALEYCIKENIPLQIVSEAEPGSVIAHYKRGRRFLPVEGKDAEKFIEKLGTDDPNIVIEEKLKSAKRGEQVECKDIGAPIMYMPEEIVEKYLERIKEHKILN